MATKKQRGGRARPALMPRASVSFPPELYKTLEELAKKKKVSIAWVVREAAERYVTAEWPLFGNTLLKGGQ
jgi:metal-responsive CopG/Arc/MetJ family transcriptional regulator